MHPFSIAATPLVPWKNGGGFTREIVSQPHGAEAGNFDWRVSVATIASSGPFSAFPGVDRTIMLLQGDGVQLQSGPDPAFAFSHRLDRPAQPFSFAGDVPVHCTLLGGESSDLNVMTRRGKYRSVTQVHGPGRSPEEVVLPSMHSGVLISLHGTWTATYAAGVHLLGAGQGLWWSAALATWILQSGDADALLVSIHISPFED